MKIRTVNATRYVTPLREGGSLPAIIEADDDGMYVLKFRGAGQGPKALIAELVAGEIGRTIGLPVPEIVFVQLDPDLARTEPDPEIQDLIRASTGLNLALDYLPGSITFDPVVTPPGADLASEIVWFDAFISNIDRTPKNPNILTWHKKLWLIDHGAALYFHHASADFAKRSGQRFGFLKEHMLYPLATRLDEADQLIAPVLSPAVIHEIIELIPTQWLGFENDVEQAQGLKREYEKYFGQRLEAPREFFKEATGVK